MTVRAKPKAITHDRLMRIYTTELEIASSGLDSLDFYS